MLRFLPLFFLALPILEIYVFFWAGDAIGGGWVISLIIMSAIIGLSLIRRQGMSAIQQAQQSMAHGQQPVNDIFKAVIVFIGGVLLVIPGFLTDALGLILLTGIGRGLIMIFFISILLPALMARGSFSAHSSFSGGASTNNDGYSAHDPIDPDIIPANPQQSQHNRGPNKMTGRQTGGKSGRKSSEIVEGEYTVEED